MADLKGKPDAIRYENGSGGDYSVGDIVDIGTQLAVARLDTADGATKPFATEGEVIEVAKATADGAVNGGVFVYWDADNSEGTVTPGQLPLLGVTVEPSADADLSYWVKQLPYALDNPRVVTAAAAAATDIDAAVFQGGKLVTILVPNTAAVSINLPSVDDVPPGSSFFLKKTTADAEIVTVNFASGEGTDNTDVDANGDQVLYVSTGAAWVLVTSTIA